MKKNLLFILLTAFSYIPLAIAQAPGNALEFGSVAVKNYITIPNGGSHPLDITGSITIEAWIKPTRKSDEANKWSTIFMKGVYGYGLVIGDDNCQSTAVGKLGYWGQNSCGRVPFSTTAIEYGKWNHVAVVISGSSLTFYINGEAAGTASGVAIPNGGVGSSLYIGAQDRTSGGSGWYKGTMDELRIWNTARSASEIKTNMYNEVDASSAGLVTYYRFDHGTAGGSNTGVTTLDDLSSNNLDGTLSDFTLSGTSSNWVESYAMVVPKALAASNVSSTGFTANWSAAEVGTVDKYLLDVSGDRDFTAFISGYNGLNVGAGTSYSVTGLSGYNGYYYRLRADKTSVTATGAKSARTLARIPVAGAGKATTLERNRSEGIQVASSSTLNFGSGSLTIEAWVKRSSDANNHSTIIGKQNSFNSIGYYLRLTNDKLSFAVGGSYPSTSYIDGVSSITDNNWHHVAAVIDVTAKNLALYIDGSLDASKSFSSMYSSTSTAALGIGFKPGYGEYFNGSLDEVRIWSTARTQAQVQEYMSTPLAGTESGLAAYWNFEDGISSVTDISGHNNTGSLLNADGDEWANGSIPYNAKVAQNHFVSLRLGGSDINSQPSASALVSSLPSNGKIYQTSNGTTRGTEITASSTYLSDAGGNPRRVIYQPNTNYTGSDSFTYQVNNGTTTSGNTHTVTITTAVNSAPTLTGGTTTLTSITEDVISSAASYISTILGGRGYADTDAGALQGIAVTAITANGNWQYSADGSTWVNFGAVSASAALLLNGNTLIRYSPDTANGETATLTFRAWDQTSGLSSTNALKQTADASTNGGSTAFSSTAAQVSISVSSVNDRPVFIGNPAFTAISEDDINSSGQSVSSILGTTVTDADNGAQQGIYIYAVSSTTNWEYSTDGGASWSAIGIVSTSSALPLRSSDYLRYQPNGQNGGSAILDIYAWDQTTGTAGTKSALSGTAYSTAARRITLTINYVNDAPVLGGTSYFLTGTDEDTPSSSTRVSTILTGVTLSDVDAGAQSGIAVSGISGNGSWQYSADGTTWTNFGTVSASAALLLSSSTQLRFSPDLQNGGPATFTFRAWDQTSGTASVNGTPGYGNTGTNGGSSAWSSATASVTLSVTEVNDLPTLTATGITTSYTENAAAVDLFSSVSINTIEAGQNIDQLILSTSNLSNGASEILNIDGTDVALTNDNSVTTGINSMSVTVSVSSTTATVTIGKTGGITTAAMQSLIDGMSYRNSSNAPTAASRLTTLTNIRDTGEAPNARSVSIAASVSVTAVNDSPVITSHGGVISPATVSVSSVENQTEVSTITASDADNASLTFSISGGTEAALFSVNSSGELRFLSAPDFENPGDSDQNNVYGVVVRVSDGTLYKEQIFVITVTDVDDTPPAIPSGLTVSSGNTQNTLNWTANSEGDLSGYKIYGGTSAFPTTLLSTIAAGTSTYTHTSLTNGTLYYYRISSVDNSNNESIPGSDVSSRPKASQTITFNVLTAKIYGDASFTLVATTSSGLPLSYSSSDPTVASVSGNTLTISNAGNITITASQAGDNSYNAAPSVSQLLTIKALAVAVKANAKSKTYGDADPALTYTFSPALISGDSFTGALSRAAGENAGSYAISQGSLTLSSNYALSFQPSALNISPKNITVTANVKNKTYGEADPALTYTFTPALISSDSFTGSLSRAAGENAGSYAISQGGLTLSSNYALSFQPSALNISPKNITVTADVKNKTYGEADPALTYTFTPALISSDSFTGSLSRAAGENAGSYAISQGGLTLSSNYALSFQPSALNINPKNITVTADVKNKTYGEADPALTYTFTPALISGDSFTGSLSRAAGENAGSYAISQGGLALSSNYALSFQPSTLNISAKAITVTANNVTKQSGTALTGGPGSAAFSVSGLNGSETIGSVTINYGEGALAAAEANTYTGSVIPANATGGTFNPANYAITYKAGNIIVIPAPSISTAGSLSVFHSCAGSISASQSFNASGSNLNTGISVTAPAGFEVSINADSGYGSSLLLEPSGSAVKSTPIYVRIKSSATGDLSGDIIISSAGTSPIAISLTGDASLIEVPTISAEGSLSFCSGESVLLSSSVSSGNQWYKDGAIIAGADSQTYNVVAGGSYMVKVSNARACSAASEATLVTVNPLPSAIITNGLIVSLGSTGSATLTANTAAGYQWYKDTVLLTGQINKTLDITQAGTYKLQVMNVSGCKAVSSPTIVAAIPSATISGATSFCAGGSVDLSVSLAAGQTFIRWKDANNNTAGNSIKYTATATGKYSAELNTPNGIESTLPVIVTVNALPEARISSNASTACAGESLTLTAGGGGTYQWYRDNNPISGANSATYQASASGSYTVRATNGSGCFSVSEATEVTIYPLPGIILAGIPSVSSTETSFTIPYLSAWGGADQYSLTGVSPMNGFHDVINAPLSGSPIRVTIPASAANTYTFNLTVRNSVTGCSSAVPVKLMLKIELTPQTITFNSLATKTYGDADFDPGAISGSGLPVKYVSSNTNVATVVSDKIHIGGAGSAIIRAIQEGNSSYLSAVPNEKLLTVSPKAITITADAKSKTYGDTDPVLTYQITSGGSVISDDGFSGVLTRTSGENVGTYAIGQGTLSLSHNYALTFKSSVLTIGKRILNIRADNKWRRENLPNPVLTASYEGFVNGETSSTLFSQPVISTAATLSSPTGIYPITAGGAAAGNYEITYSEGILTISPGAPKSIELKSVTVYENQPAGTLIGTLSSSSDDPDAIFTYTLVPGAGDADNLMFAIKGNEIKTAGALNYEEKTSYTIRVRSSTRYGLMLEKELSIRILDVNEAPALAAIANNAFCYTSDLQSQALDGISAGPESGQSTTLSVTSSNADLFQQLNITDKGVLSYRIRDGRSGEAIVTVTIKDDGGIANGGKDTYSQSFILTVNPLPEVTITANKPTDTFKGEEITLTAYGGVSYRWHNARGIVSGQNSASLNIRPEETTTYHAEVKTAAGCIAEKEITIKVKEDFIKLNANNIISPNGDGKNDKLVIKNLDMYPNNEVKIFDRAGRIVYSKVNYTDEWDGTIQGSPLAEDTYYYVVDFGEGKPKLKGYITIVRD